jgi:hypothetical protein
MTELEGCAVLKARFEAAGCRIIENHPLGEVPIELDGWDAERRVGYEWITTEAGDRDEVTPEVVAALEHKMAAGELYVLLVDEYDVDGPEELARAADRFLARLREQGTLP